MKRLKGIAVCTVLSLSILLSGCEKTDIHEIEPLTKDMYEKTLPETFTVKRGELQPVIKLKLNQNSLRYYNYAIDFDDVEFSSLNVSNGDYVREGQVLAVFKSEKIEKKVREASETLETDRILLEHVKKLKSINYDPEKTEDEANINIGIMYDNQIAAIEDDIRLKTIELEESQRDLDKCIIKAKESGVITYVSDAISHGLVVKSKDIITEACGDVGFFVDVKNVDYEFEVGSVYKATSPTMEFDVKITEIEENSVGGITIHFHPVNDDIVYVSNERFEVVIPKEKLKDVVYIEDRLVYTSADERRFVLVVDENGFKNPVYVEVDGVVEEMAVIKSGLVGGEEVAVK